MPAVSVIVPIFGVENYIERCVFSLFSQSMPDDEIEYIFVNDYTNDSSVKILERIISEYPQKNTKILHHTSNKGLPAARRTGIEAASGEFIIHCDSDDWVEPTYCQEMYETAVNTGSDVVICGYWINDGKEKWEDDRFNDLLSADQDTSMSSALSLSSSPFIWNKMVKRKMYEQPLIYPTHYLAEDWVLSVQFAFYSSKTTVIHSRLYNYFVNPNSPRLSNDKKNCITKCKNEVANVELILQWLKSKNLHKKYRAEMVRRATVAKMQLNGVLDDHECQKLWIATFKCVNFLIFFNKYTSKNFKIKHALILLHLYSPTKKVYMALKKIIRCKFSKK